jgi:hypothetical protein
MKMKLHKIANKLYYETEIREGRRKQGMAEGGIFRYRIRFLEYKHL